MGDGTEQNPFTREDVLRLKKENGGTAKGLDLSGEHFQEGINLQGINLKRANLRGAHLEKAVLWSAHLEGADLSYAHLERALLEHAHLKGTDLCGAHLEGADLRDAHLKGADLSYAHLEDAHLDGTKLEGAFIRGSDILKAHLEEADWGNFILGEEREFQFDAAAATYRQLKMWHTHAGYHDIAAKFYYREREASRKEARHWNDRAAGWLSWAVFGHGEGWERILIWIVGFILLFALIYFSIGSVWEWSAFWKSLYFSAVSFTALGYGEWVNLNNDLTGDIIRGLGAFESLVGISMMALLLVTFFRKWTR